jgi:hypothetical protein
LHISLFSSNLGFLMNLKPYSERCFRRISGSAIVDVCIAVRVLQLKEELIKSSVVATNFLIGKNVKWRKIVYALNPNFNCFLRKIWCIYHVDIAFTGHWHRGIVYNFLLLCLSCSYILKLLINSSFNWHDFPSFYIFTNKKVSGDDSWNYRRFSPVADF